MGFFDILASAVANGGSQQPHEALDSVLQNTPLGGMSGLLDQLSQNGLAGQVASWAGGQTAHVTPDEVTAALDDTHLQGMASSLGISPDEVAGYLSSHLPALASAFAGASGYRPS